VPAAVIEASNDGRRTTIEIAVFAAILGFLIGGIAVAIVYYILM
jgi:hypothetical protein